MFAAIAGCGRSPRSGSRGTKRQPPPFPYRYLVWFVHGVCGLALGVCLARASLMAAAEPEDLESLLKRFRDELLPIVPGEEPYPAEFELGTEDGTPAEKPVFRVRLAPFAIARYETPQNLYAAIMGHNPSRWQGRRNAVENVTWQEARAFCERLTHQLRARQWLSEDEEIRLPSEAEWEYACRAGTRTAYSFGDSPRLPADPPGRYSLLDHYAWHTGNAAGNDPPVGALKPNPWGLYDMHGYVWEMTLDGWQSDHQQRLADGRAQLPTTPQQPITLRGGSWKDDARWLRSSARRPFAQQARDDGVGFRCVQARLTSKTAP
ncbi:MAG: hypothetical protein KatS3mg114_1384 [Planctomycetaceae bacterium]|nr:MAG: hypothetical protein KatS3mg114_1384 [Planctomycetaceae bacterium]